MAVVIEGLDDLMRKLDRLGGNVLDALERAVNTTTLAAQGDAKFYAPVDTGALSVSINTETKRTGTKATGKVFTNSPYAIYQEMGTVKMAAHPYMMPALNANKSTFEMTTRNELHDAIKRAGG